MNSTLGQCKVIRHMNYKWIVWRTDVYFTFRNIHWKSCPLNLPKCGPRLLAPMHRSVESYITSEPGIQLVSGVLVLRGETSGTNYVPTRQKHFFPNLSAWIIYWIKPVLEPKYSKWHQDKSFIIIATEGANHNLTTMLWIQRWSSRTSVWQKTRIFCSRFFTVHSTGGF